MCVSSHISHLIAISAWWLLFSLLTRHNPQVHSSLITIILWTSTETIYLQRLNSRVGIFTFMVTLATKTKLPVQCKWNAEHKILNASPVSRPQPWPTLFHVLCFTVVLTELDSRLLFLYCFLAWYIMLLSCTMSTTSCLQFYFVNILLTSFAALYNLGRYPRTFFVVCIPYGMVNDLCTTISHQDMLQLGKSVECINTQNVFCTVVNSSLLTWVDNWLSAQCDYQHSPTVLFNLRKWLFCSGCTCTAILISVR